MGEKESPDLALINAGELVTCVATTKDELGVIADGALLVDEGLVTWVGTTKKFRQMSVKPTRVVNADGGLVTPGFVDPHTHLVFAGSREDELERKVSGEGYKKILQEGGGISRTIRETRNASKARLVRESKGRVLQLMRNGVTTAEVKSGYGQNVKEELKMLAAVKALGAKVEVGLVPTLLGLHAKPPEFKGSGEYVDYAVREMLPKVAASKMMPRFSDCFCEEGVFSREDCARYLRASAKAGFALKIHADEFGDSGGASLAGDLKCVSADHLGRSSKQGIEMMAKEGVVAVLMPGTSLFSGIPYADARMIVDSGCTVALGTDMSPNSWIESPQLVMSLACSGMRMTPAEALLGFTRNAAKALNREDIGVLGVGYSGDFVVHTLPSYRFLPYRVGGEYVRGVFRKGREIFHSEET
ncbi:MAG: imidazolonepropionase [Thaumarchaeota archaeon]|nr:imidazolonepropionase [Nitrososphaerota archaeon]